MHSYLHVHVMIPIRATFEENKITIGTLEAYSVNPSLEMFGACLTGRDPELYEGLLFTSALERLWFPKGSCKLLLVKGVLIHSD